MNIDVRANNFINYAYIDDGTLIDDINNKIEYLAIYNYLNNNNLNNDVYGSVFYLINELDRNVRNHADIGEDDFYTLSINLDNNILKISILDNGIGIENSLKKVNSNYTDNILINATVLGVSAHSNWDLASIDSRNSGYGLYLISEVALFAENNIEIISGFHRLCKFDKNLAQYSLDKYQQGTNINLAIDCETINERINIIQHKTSTKSIKSNFSSALNEKIIREFEYLNNKLVKTI